MAIVTNLHSHYYFLSSSYLLFFYLQSYNIDQGHTKSIPVRISRFTARNPIKCLIGALSFATLLSVIGLYVGNFKVEVDNKGWRSRKTTISNREMQAEVLNTMRRQLFNDDDGSVWEDIKKDALSNEFIELVDREYDERRNLYDRHADESSCKTQWYESRGEFHHDNLFAMWKVEPDKETTTKSILDKDILSQICDAETKSRSQLEEIGACGTCSSDDEGVEFECPLPYSLTLVLRHYIGGAGSFDMTCSELMDAYSTGVQQEFTNALVKCTQEMKNSWDPATESFEGNNMSACPQYFIPHLVDTAFAVNGNTLLRYSSSYFNTYKSGLNEDSDLDLDNRLFDMMGSFDGADGAAVMGIYDTINETFNSKLADVLLVSDMRLVSTKSE